MTDKPILVLLGMSPVTGEHTHIIHVFTEDVMSHLDRPRCGNCKHFDFDPRFRYPPQLDLGKCVNFSKSAPARYADGEHVTDLDSYCPAWEAKE